MTLKSYELDEDLLPFFEALGKKQHNELKATHEYYHGLYRASYLLHSEFESL